MVMVGEAERRERFAFALQKALDARGRSVRSLALELKVDPRQITRWLNRKGLPDLYEAQALASALKVDEELFRKPPAVPPPPPVPYYPIEKYLLGAVDRGVERGLTDELPPDEAGPAPGGRPRRRRPPKPG